MQENENVRNIDVSITISDIIGKQERHEICVLLCNQFDDEVKKAIVDYFGIDYDSLTDYELFIILWVLMKSIEGYTHSKIITGIDIWDMKMCMLNDNTIVFENGDGEIVFNEEAYKTISNGLWNEIKENSNANT